MHGCINLSTAVLSTNSSCWEEVMVNIPSTPAEFQQTLAENQVVLMANSPAGQSIQKYFFYAQQVQ